LTENFDANKITAAATQYAEQGLCNSRASASLPVYQRSTAAAVAGGFAAKRRRRLQQISIHSCGLRATGAGDQQQMQAASRYDGGSTLACFI